MFAPPGLVWPSVSADQARPARPGILWSWQPAGGVAADRKGDGQAPLRPQNAACCRRVTPSNTIVTAKFRSCHCRL